jgi:hypothetical protein
VDARPVAGSDGRQSALPLAVDPVQRLRRYAELLIERDGRSPVNLRPLRRAAWSSRSTRDSSAALADNAVWLAIRVVKVRTSDDKGETCAARTETISKI